MANFPFGGFSQINSHQRIFLNCPLLLCVQNQRFPLFLRTGCAQNTNRTPKQRSSNSCCCSNSVLQKSQLYNSYQKLCFKARLNLPAVVLHRLHFLEKQQQQFHSLHHVVIWIFDLRQLFLDTRQVTEISKGDSNRESADEKCKLFWLKALRLPQFTENDQRIISFYDDFWRI